MPKPHPRRSPCPEVENPKPRSPEFRRPKGPKDLKIMYLGYGW